MPEEESKTQQKVTVDITERLCICDDVENYTICQAQQGDHKCIFHIKEESWCTIM
jgi:hypothetical protein